MQNNRYNFSSKTTEELIDMFNLERLKKGWVGQRGYFIDALFTTFKNRDIDVSAIEKIENGNITRSLAKPILLKEVHGKLSIQITH